MPGRPRRGLARLDFQIQKPHFFYSLEVRLSGGRFDGHFSGGLFGFIVRVAKATRSEGFAEMDHADYRAQMLSPETAGAPYGSSRLGRQSIRAEHACPRRENSAGGRRRARSAASHV